MDADQSGIPPEETMAAELALGLLEGDALAVALRRTLAEPAFAAEVDAWRERISPLHADVVEQAPPGELWPLIEGRLGEAAPGGAIISRLNRWRALALVSTGIAACLGAFMILGSVQQPPPVAQPMMVAQIAGEDTGPVMLASYHAATRRFRIEPATMPVNGQSPELWLIPADGKPRSLGIFDPSKRTDMLMPKPMMGMINSDAVIAVSMEPLGGSPTGLPTGPVVAKGKLLAI